jgi:choline dehydrogenase
MRVLCDKLSSSFYFFSICSYLSSRNDVQVLLRGMHMLNRVAQTAPFADDINHGNRDALFGHRLAQATDDAIIEYIRTTLESLYHPTSTARMGKLVDGGVVDAELRVHGVKNLRVVDASVFPTIPSGHTVSSLANFFFEQNSTALNT